MNEKLRIIQRYFKYMWWMLRVEWQCLCLFVHMCAHTCTTAHPEGRWRSLWWLRVIIHLDYSENLPDFLFIFPGNQSHGESSPFRAHCLCSCFDYYLCLLDCLQSHSHKPGLRCWQKSLILKCWFSIFHMIWEHGCSVMYSIHVPQSFGECGDKVA